MPKAFSEVLRRLRQEAGFKTPHFFYARSGGRKVLGFSYITYWKIERGLFLPKAERLGLLISRLGIAPLSSQARELAGAFLKDLLGSEEAYEWLLKTLETNERRQEASVGERAAQRLMHEETCYLSVAQTEAILRDYSGYWSFVVLCNDKGSWKASDLARKLGVGQADLGRSLKRLSSHGIVKFLPDGSVRSPLAGKHCLFGPEAALRWKGSGKTEHYHARMIKERGALVSNKFAIPRVEELESGSYVAHLNKAVSDAHLYSVYEGPRRSAQYFVEAKVYRLFPF